jgi:hypothetical protein
LSHNLYTYGTTDPIYFVLVDSAGARVASHTFVATDVYLIVDGGADIDIYAECSHVSKGLYKWDPLNASRTQREVISVLITDSSLGSTFIDNSLIIATGGHASARFSG